MATIMATANRPVSGTDNAMFWKFRPVIKIWGTRKEKPANAITTRTSMRPAARSTWMPFSVRLHH